MANVKLSAEESELVTNAELILTKNRIIHKVYELFGDLSEEYKHQAVVLPAGVTRIPPKIARGENYLGLPWVMMDYPRVFTKTDVFAVRSFFWWGNFFSITLQLQGSYKLKYEQSIVHHIESHPEGWWIGVSSAPWDHHFEESNYVAYQKDIHPDKLPFFKLAKKIPLQQWDNSFEFFIETFKQFASMLSAQPVK